MMRSLLVAASCLLSPILHAAITVNGLADESTYTSGSVTFTVPSEAGFDIVAELDGVGIPLDAAHTETGPGYHELLVTKTPSGGGAAEEETLQFIVHDPARPSSDNGMPTWTPYPPADAPDAVLDTTTVSFFTPASVTPGLAFPLVVRLEDGTGDIAKLNATALISDADGNSASLKLRRGAGSGSWTAPATGPFTLTLHLGTGTFAQPIAVANPAAETLSGSLASSRTFAAGTVVNVTADSDLPAGMTLRFEAGCIVKLAAGVTIEILGTLEIAGTTGNLVLFLPADPAQAWGGFHLHGGATAATVTGAMLTGAGADQSWASANGISAHRGEQPVFGLDAGTSGGTCIATLTDTWIIDNPLGQAGLGRNADVTFTRCLIQRTRTCGQFNAGVVNFFDSHAIELPLDSQVFSDADNDAIYLSGGTHHFRDSVIGWTKDDGIDCGGSAAGTLLVEDCWMESCFHEAFALSGDKVVTVTGTVSTNNGQGLEVGYSNTGTALLRPDATATGCLLVGNAHGARYGDNYDWTYRGKLDVGSSLILHNIADVFGHEWDSWDYRSADMTIENNVVTTALESHPTNTTLDPVTHAPQVAAFLDQPAMARGFRIATREAQNPRADYGGSIGVHLDRPASDGISIGWKILAMPTLGAATEIEVATGTLDFPTGATFASLDLPALSGPAAASELIAVQFDDSAGATATGPSACHFLDFGTTFDPVLVAFGSTWHYLADGSDQDTAWREPMFLPTGWPDDPARLGYGGRGEVTEVGFVDADPVTSGTQKNATTYFRHQFEVADKSAFDSLSLELLYDDGGVVYLNGTRVAATFNMPAGDPDHDFYIGTALSSNDTYETFPLAASALNNGTNTLAVEIHQAGPTSSDISFDLELTATPAATGDIDATATNIDGHPHLFWTNPDVVPQSSPDLDSWLQRPDLTSPLIVKPKIPGPPREFYRLSLP